MLYYPFKNYEEFKELFGVTTHSNGAKSRRNKILLNYLKQPNLLAQARESGDNTLINITSMSQLKQVITDLLARKSRVYNNYRCNIMDQVWCSDSYELDDYNGLCEDGDSRSIRYINKESERVYKMKAGKFYRSLILGTAYGRSLPESLVIWLCEDFATSWQSYAMTHLPDVTLHVDDDFEAIYSVSDMGSCMANEDQYSFYENSVNASAAYLKDKEDEIIARCVVFNEVTEESNGKVWRLAERQYSKGSDIVLQRLLVDKLIQGGHIDGYKAVGVDCHNSRSFVGCDGDDLSDKRFYIDCSAERGDTISYQDSFKWLSVDYGRAYNHSNNSYDYELDTTESTLGDDQMWDEYHEEYCDSTIEVSYHGRYITCDVEALEDFVEIDGIYYYYEDTTTCELCGETVLCDDSCYSELTEESYCCYGCLESAEESYKEYNWTYSEYDNEYYEDDSKVVTYTTARGNEMSIHVDSLTELIENGEVVLDESGEYKEVA